jgi:hypothetical protein
MLWSNTLCRHREEDLMKLYKVVATATMFSLPVTASYSETKTAPKVHTSETKKVSPAAKVDLNSASQAELEKLPGIGPVTAKKIIAGRPYAAPGDLAKVGVPAKTINRIAPLVGVGVPATVKPMAPKASAPYTPVKVPTSPQAVAPAKTSKPAMPPPVGENMVWVNTESKIYHKPGSKWYGKTKQGRYMTESEAIKEGYRAAKSVTK